jgi:hypothetical protein
VVMKASLVVFWVVTMCSHVDGYQRFGGMYDDHVQGCTTEPGILHSVTVFSPRPTSLQIKNRFSAKFPTHKFHNTFNFQV